MSVRRVQGRFMAHSATEAYQRQLAAPAHKWKKAWVTPNGLGPESSYKVCKWVRVPKDEDDGDDGFTQALDGDEDEDVEDGDEGTPAETPGAVTPDVDLPPPSGLSTAPAAPSALSAPPLTAGSLTPSESANDTPALETPALALETPAEQTPAVEIPAEENAAHTTNVFEVSNSAPGHTEDGQGDLGAGGVVVESGVVTETDQVESSGDVAPDGDVDMAEDKAVEVAEISAKGDEGLIMGETEPPQTGLAVQGSDAAPPEVEATNE